MPIQRALLSVHDKTGLVEFAQALAAHGVELIASGGTARAITGAGLPCTTVESLTGFPELLGGRVKTLHPSVHAGILARRTPEHLADLQRQGLKPIDLVACNLYPFQRTVARKGVTVAEAIEEIDIGGVTLLRAAAKNHEFVTVCCDPADYATVSHAVHTWGEVPDDTRRALALKAFRHTAAYDAAISAYLGRLVEGEEAFPGMLALTADKAQDLRYGENPHQRAAFYRWSDVPAALTQISGEKEMSYNNYVDLDAAWGMAQEFDAPTVAIIKHTNPCGLASASSLEDAYRKAYAADPASAYGSVIAVNQTLDMATVRAMGSLFVEVLAAPGFAPEAREALKAKKNLRALLVRPEDRFPWVIRSVHGGVLAQTPDVSADLPSTWKVVTKRVPTPEELRSLEFAWKVAKHVKSNAIVFARGTEVVGVGAGQMSRVDSVYLAARKAGDKARGAVVGSDAFFPFPDGIEAAAAAGCTAIVQPGGSVRDEEAIDTADRLGLAMCFTGVRHFRH
jgi:phosphoribosylaminoimidazolecarboxamide formyltransferase/IMP cyclohydrolase